MNINNNNNNGGGGGGIAGSLLEVIIEQDDEIQRDNQRITGSVSYDGAAYLGIKKSKKSGHSGGISNGPHNSKKGRSNEESKHTIARSKKSSSEDHHSHLSDQSPFKYHSP